MNGQTIQTVSILKLQTEITNNHDNNNSFK